MEKEFTYGAGNMGPDFISGSFTRPVPGFNYISSRFGMRTLYGKPDYHVGIDIAGGGIYGQPIVAAHAGYVTVARYGSTGYGNRVYIDGGGGVITRYGHCSSLAVAEGTFVAQGQTIAYVGSTGNSTGPHLHFEIRQNGTAVNPAPYLGY
ncbi:MAG: M23 family metallopeptidase [Oscillospiraceae bacterium]